MLHIYWNSPAHTGDGYLSDAGSRFGWVMSPPDGFVMGDGLTTTSYQFRLALVPIGLGLGLGLGLGIGLGLGLGLG